MGGWPKILSEYAIKKSKMTKKPIWDGPYLECRHGSIDVRKMGYPKEHLSREEVWFLLLKQEVVYGSATIKTRKPSMGLFIEKTQDHSGWDINLFLSFNSSYDGIKLIGRDREEERWLRYPNISPRSVERCRGRVIFPRLVERWRDQQRSSRSG